MNDLVEDYIAQGYSIHGAAGKLGIAKSTLYEWKAKYPKFSDGIERGLSKALAMLEMRLIALVSGKKIDKFDPKYCDKQILMFILKSRWHDIYGERIQIKEDTPHAVLMGYIEKMKSDVGNT